MTCREFWSRMPELDSGERQCDHLRECKECAREMERQRVLAVGLRHLARKGSTLDAPPRVETGLLAAFRNYYAGISAPVAADRWWSHVWTWVPIAAACLLLAGFLIRGLGPRPTPVPPIQFASVESEDADGSDAGFIPLPYATETPSGEEADLVHVRVSRSTLLGLGVPLSDGPGDAVEAEVLLGAGGAPQAVRVLP